MFDLLCAPICVTRRRVSSLLPLNELCQKILSFQLSQFSTQASIADNSPFRFRRYIEAGSCDCNSWCDITVVEPAWFSLKSKNLQNWNPARPLSSSGHHFPFSSHCYDLAFQHSKPACRAYARAFWHGCGKLGQPRHRFGLKNSLPKADDFVCRNERRTAR